MTTLSAVALAAAALLLLASAMKVLEPADAASALDAIGLPVRTGLVRLGAILEGAVGAAALAAGGRVAWVLVAGSYAGLAVVVLAVRRAGDAGRSCGCFGRRDTPARWSHAALNVGLAGVVAAVAVRTPTTAIGSGRGSGTLTVGLALAATGLLCAAYLGSPRRADAGGRPHGVR